MTSDLIKDFIGSQNYDVRVTGNGRWIDQKCAADAVCFIADCILEYIRGGGKVPFISPDIWKSAYAITAVQQFFGKPDPLTASTLDEYNKFFRQPMKMLAAAGLLIENKVGSKIEFQVAHIEILEYIALRERHSLEFLFFYIEKTLQDSDLWSSFKEFFSDQNTNSYIKLKTYFFEFCKKYTPINTETEANRIFIKVLNPLAFKLNMKGTVRGRLSPNNITFDQIMYNQPNWRDILAGKGKNIARGDFIPSQSDQQLYDYQVARAKKNLRRFNDTYNDATSEVSDELAIENAVHMHHIFPQNEFQKIAAYIENLIAVTAGQHLDRAHPKGRTTRIDIAYQYLCLICKTESIRKNLLDNEGAPLIYNFSDFMFVLDTGLDTDHFGGLPSNDFVSVLAGIETNHDGSQLASKPSRTQPSWLSISSKPVSLWIASGVLLFILWSFWA